jgi:hypothetical protein
MKDKNKRRDIFKVFLLVSVLILSTLGMTFSTIGTDSENGAGLSAAGASGGFGSSRGARQAAVPLVESVPAATTLTVFVGEQDIDFDVVLRSLFTDDDDDTNGDNVLYNISMLGTNPSTNPGAQDNLMRFDYSQHIFVNYSTPIYTWDTSQAGNDGPGTNNHMLYTAGDYGPWKQVINQNNSFLDEDNDGTVDADEYWSVKDMPKSYGDFIFDILGTAEPGYYRMKFKVSYEYQDKQEVSINGVGNGSTRAITNSNLFTNQALGDFEYYYWCPWDTFNDLFPADVVDLYVNNTPDVGYKKYSHTPYRQQNTSTSDNWEGMEDNGVDKPSVYTDRDNDGQTEWIPFYVNPAAPPTRATILANMDADYTAKILSNWPGSPIIDQFPFNLDTGNGTWEYQGRTAEPFTTWEPPRTHTDDVWFDFIINSTVAPGPDHNDDNETNDLKLMASDDNYYTGSNFEEFFIPIKNADPTIEMRNVEATLFLPTNINEGGYVFYSGRNVATVNQVDPAEEVNLNYRLSVDPMTPPGFYYGQMQLNYLKRFPTNDIDALGNPLTADVDVFETHWVVQFEVDYTPDMGDASITKPGLAISTRAIDMPDTEIDTSVSKQIFEFTVRNTGNVELFGGDMDNGNLHLNFAEFKQEGDEYFDADADPGIEFDAIPIPAAGLPVDTEHKTNITVDIPNHWYLQEGIYRLYLNFTGYYYDDGALGDSSGFVYMEINWMGANDDNLPRDCYVMVDENGNETVDDPADSARLTKGMYTDIYINQFNPKDRELAIIDYTPKILYQENLVGGSSNFSVTFQNPPRENIDDFTMYDIYVEFDIEGYFDESYYYDWTTPTSRPNPKFYLDQLDPLAEWTVNFTVDDLDKLLPEGEHHIPVKYSYDYDIPNTGERDTFGMVWDTGTTPFKPYIDANMNFMLNKAAGGTRAAGPNSMDIMFVIDQTNYASTAYYTRLRNAMDSFANDLNTNNVDYQIGIVGFREDTWLVQDLTTDINLIKSQLSGMTTASGQPGTYDAVIETIENTLTSSQMISYRSGATKVIILVTDEYPRQGTNNEMTFGFAIKGEGIFFGIHDQNDAGYYSDTILATGGLGFNVFNGDYTAFMNSMANTLGAYIVGMSPAGARIYDVPLEDVADSQAVNLDSYGPYLIVIVSDTAFDIDTDMVSSPISLGGRVRDINLRVQLTNQEYVRYTDVEVKLPLTPEGETNAIFINPVNDSQPIMGDLTSTSLEPKGGSIQATFNLDVDLSADSGVYQFDLQFSAMNDYTKQLVSGTIPVDIRIYPKQPILIIPQKTDSGKEGTPEVTAKNVKPGSTFTLSFTLENVGDDVARDVYVTLSNDWYMNDPFTTIDAYVTSLSSHTTTYYASGALQNVSRKADTKLSDLGVSSTSDIVDAERQLLAPTAMVPRVYIPEIHPGAANAVEVSFKLRADTHMIPGRPYREYVLVEYIDSDGLVYRYDETNPQLSTQPLPIVIHTKEDDDWTGEETAWSETLAILLIIIIVIIIIILLLSSVFQKRRTGGPEEERREFRESEEEFPDEDEDLEDEFPPPQDEEDLEEEEPTEEEPPEEEEEEEEEDEDWAVDEEKADKDEGLEEEEDEEDDWAISEEESKKKPAKGKMPIPIKVKGKAPAKGKDKEGKAAIDDDEIDDWD